ncbi:MAG: SDR family oxidoreductase [Candidatus Sericytochromatia bacterium]|nr:SDR family oxidoreductase [Candidatus Sericytochromatia bacterium]
MSHPPLPENVFVSGASKGIGLAIARTFLNEGFNVAISARTEADLQALKAEHPGLQTFQADMSRKEDVLRLADWLNTEFGTLDLLVNNVGRFLPGQIHSESDETFENTLHTNLFGPYYLTKRVLPPMMARKQGTIVNICSTASITAYPNGGSYCISKFALHGFSKELREELKPHNIRVVSVLPGATFTASWEGADVPEERLMPAEDIAAAVWQAWAMSPRTVVEEILLRPMLGDLG